MMTDTKRGSAMRLDEWNRLYPGKDWLRAGEVRKRLAHSLERNVREFWPGLAHAPGYYEACKTLAITLMLEQPQLGHAPRSVPKHARKIVKEHFKTHSLQDTEPRGLTGPHNKRGIRSRCLAMIRRFHAWPEALKLVCRECVHEQSESHAQRQ